jgi:Flp pilus assembly protein TadB
VRSGTKRSDKKKKKKKKKKRRLPNRTHLHALEERNNNKGGVRVGVDGCYLLLSHRRPLGVSQDV